MNRGRFLSLEGVEGVGKTTNLEFILNYLRDQGIEVVQTREPGGTALGEKVRDLVLHTEITMRAETELLLMYASRIELVNQVIIPELESGKWVVADRFADASFAYQGGGRQLGFDKVKVIDQWAIGALKPDCTLFLDLPVEQGLQRLAARADKDRIEQESTDFFEIVRCAYLQRIENDPSRFNVIDASKPLVQVQQAIRQALDHQLAACVNEA